MFILQWERKSKKRKKENGHRRKLSEKFPFGKLEMLFLFFFSPSFLTWVDARELTFGGFRQLPLR